MQFYQGYYVKNDCNDPEKGQIICHFFDFFLYSLPTELTQNFYALGPRSNIQVVIDSCI